MNKRTAEAEGEHVAIVAAELAGGDRKAGSLEVREPDHARDALVAAIAAAGGPGRDEAWKILVGALALLGTERIVGWKGIAAAIGVSVTRARELADRRHPFRLPVRYGARGTYITRLALALWVAEYDAPFGAHDGMKASRRCGPRSRP